MKWIVTEVLTALVSLIVTAFILFGVAAFVGAQPLQRLPMPPGSVVITDEPAPRYAKVVTPGVPLILFVGAPSRAIKGLVTHRDDQYPHSQGNGVYILDVDADGKWTTFRSYLPATASDLAIREAVSRPAVPFDTSLGKSTAEGSPWLSREASEQIRDMWPSSVPLLDGLRFYKPTRYGQYTAIVGSRMSFQSMHMNAGGDNPNLLPKYFAPGGLADVPKSEWRSYTGIVLGGRIAGFQEFFPFRYGIYDGVERAGAASPGNMMQKRTAAFGRGITAVDLLVNKFGKPFAVRAITIEEDGTPDFMTLFKDPKEEPAGFTLGGKKCVDCHKPGPGSSRYGPGVRGHYPFFSVPVFKEGTVEWDTENFPIDLVADRTGPGPTPDDGPALAFEPIREPLFGIPSRGRSVFGRRR